MEHAPMNAHRPVVARERKFPRMPIIVVTIILLAVVGAIFAWNTLLTPNLVKKSQYQAVFLTNGQVYFGKLESGGPQFLRLKDVYYLQTNQDPQKTEGADKTANDQTQTLIRLGKEIHGPDNEMLISRDQVLFFENISNDGTVGKAIQNDKQKK